MTTGTSAGRAQTVLGPVEPGQLGITLTHEHLLIDLRIARKAPPEQASAKDMYYQPVALHNLGMIRYHSLANADNSLLLDVSTAIDEASLYRQHGGGTLVDATSIGIARDPTGLARISRATGVHVIMGASYYVADAHPAEVEGMTEDEIVAQIVSDVTVGVGDTGIRSGIIGEVGCSWPLAGNERKVLRASARAQRLTGAPLLIHPGRDEVAPLEIIEVLREAGADLDRTIMGHLDRTVFMRETLKAIAESGCYMEWDLFGREQSYYSLNPDIDMPGDAKRIEDIAWITDEGFGGKVLVAHDICSKDRLIKYGGHGYFYILAKVVPQMRSRGFSEEWVRRILVENPAEALAFTEPASA